MLMALSCIHNDQTPQDIWNKYYNSDCVFPQYYQLENCNVTAEEDKTFVFECSFISLKNRAIDISNVTLKFLHSFCFFENCTAANGNGGSIYFDCDSPIVQDRFCSIKASCPNYGAHSYTYLENYNNNKLNIVVESCISLSGFERNTRTIEMDYGICGIFSSNISKNYADICSGFYIANPCGCCVINFTTVENNIATVATCIAQNIVGIHGISCSDDNFGLYVKFHDFFSNIVNNSQNYPDSGCIITDAELIIENCTILNKYSKGKTFLITCKSAKLTIINCKVDNFSIFQSGGTYSTSNIVITKEYNPLFHISTHKCHAIRDFKYDNNQSKYNKDNCLIEMKRKSNCIPYFSKMDPANKHRQSRFLKRR